MKINNRKKMVQYMLWIVFCLCASSSSSSLVFWLRFSLSLSLLLLLQWSSSSLFYLQWNSFFYSFIRIKLDICFAFLLLFFLTESLKNIVILFVNRKKEFLKMPKVKNWPKLRIEQKKNQRWSEKKECWKFP